MKRSARLLLLATAAISMVAGCDVNYSTLRFRPVDTSNQMTVGDVHVLVSHNGAGGIGGGVDEGSTDQHGQINLANLHAGDVLTFIKPGYQSTRIKLGPGSYRQSAPASSGQDVLFDLTDMDAVPIPLHRDGNVVRPTTMSFQSTLK